MKPIRPDGLKLCYDIIEGKQKFKSIKDRDLAFSKALFDFAGPEDKRFAADAGEDVQVRCIQATIALRAYFEKYKNEIKDFSSNAGMYHGMFDNLRFKTKNPENSYSYYLDSGYGQNNNAQLEKALQDAIQQFGLSDSKAATPAKPGKPAKPAPKDEGVEDEEQPQKPRRHRMLPVDDVCAATNIALARRKDVAVIGRSVADQSGSFQDVINILNYCDFKGKNFIVFPVLQHGHFVSIVIDLKNHTISQIDSLSLATNIKDELLNALEEKFGQEFTVAKVKKGERLQQGADVLCGFHAVLNNVLGVCDFKNNEHKENVSVLLNFLFNEKIEVEAFTDKSALITVLQAKYNAFNEAKKIEIEEKITQIAKQNRQKVAADQGETLSAENIEVNKVFGFINDILHTPRLDSYVRELCVQALVMQAGPIAISNSLMMQLSTSASIDLDTKKGREFIDRLTNANVQISADPFLTAISEFIDAKGGKVDARNVEEFVKKIQINRDAFPLLELDEEENILDQYLNICYNAINDSSFPERQSLILSILEQAVPIISGDEDEQKDDQKKVFQMLGAFIATLKNDKARKEFLEKNILSKDGKTTFKDAKTFLNLCQVQWSQLAGKAPKDAERDDDSGQDDEEQEEEEAGRPAKPAKPNKPKEPTATEKRAAMQRDIATIKKREFKSNRNDSAFEIAHDTASRELIIRAKNPEEHKEITAAQLAFQLENNGKVSVIGDTPITQAISPNYIKFHGLTFKEEGGQKIFGSAKLFMANFDKCHFKNVDFSAIDSDIIRSMRFTNCIFENCKGIDIQIFQGPQPATIKQTATAMKEAVNYDAKKYVGKKMSTQEMTQIKEMLASQGIAVVAKEDNIRGTDRDNRKSSVDHALERLARVPGTSPRTPKGYNLEVRNTPAVALP